MDSVVCKRPMRNLPLSRSYLEWPLGFKRRLRHLKRVGDYIYIILARPRLREVRLLRRTRLAHIMQRFARVAKMIATLSLLALPLSVAADFGVDLDSAAHEAECSKAGDDMGYVPIYAMLFDAIRHRGEHPLAVARVRRLDVVGGQEDAERAAHDDDDVEGRDDGGRESEVADRREGIA